MTVTPGIVMFPVTITPRSPFHKQTVPLPLQHIAMKKVLFIITLIALMTSCDKNEDENIVLDGTYAGTFQRQTGAPADTAVTVQLTFTGQQFNGAGDWSAYPAICHGTYQLQGDSIRFDNGCVFTADFDWTLILGGKYDIYAIADQVIMTRTYGNQSKDIYNLRKVTLK